MRTSLFIILALAACGDDGGSATPDAKPAADAAVTADAPAATLDCASYCTRITANCVAPYTQYQDPAHCMATCMKFPVGTLADTSGNTLGCRIYHADNVVKTSMPAVHCPHAGPGGAKIDAPAPGTCGDACTSFCSIVAGSAGVCPTEYPDVAGCVTTCNGFDKTVQLGADGTAAGNNLACRLYHATNAAISAANATTHCPHTAMVSTVCK